MKRSEIIQKLVELGKLLHVENEELNAVISKTYFENNWLIKDNYHKNIDYWSKKLNENSLQNFVRSYDLTKAPKNVGIIMAGNIPMVGFHDLLCVLLSGHHAEVKPSSDDKHVTTYICRKLSEFGLRIKVVDKIENIDAVIATGSNNSFKYFQHYFGAKPNLLRKNRKSLAILNGNESSEELKLLGKDVFEYFGLGCRNVSLIMLPRSSSITDVLDQLMHYKDIGLHNKYANNYTYHRAMLLMNSEEHLDTGFLLVKKSNSLYAPLSCIHYYYYDDIAEIDTFISQNKENIQCIVGNYSEVENIPFGKAQEPELEDFADKIDTMSFLKNLA